MAGALRIWSADPTTVRAQEEATAADEDDDWDPEHRTVTLHWTIPACPRRECDELQAELTCPAVQVPGERFPLLVFTGGFATQASQYDELVGALALSGCAVLRYDVPGASLATDDALVAVLRSVLDYASSSEELLRFARAGKVVLVGHSRGAKLSSLAAAADERVGGLCLLDPIDNTVWAPVKPGFPSACEALKGLWPRRLLPVAIVGAGTGGDCAPADANYQKFFEAAKRPVWLVVIPTAGHAQFLDRRGAGLIQRAICGSGTVDDTVVQEVAAAVCLAWASLVSGPVRPVGRGSVAERVGLVEETAARAEIAGQVTKLTLPGARRQAQEAAISVSVAAKTTVDGLQRLGISVESYVRV